IICALSLVACATFNPQPMQEVPFLERAQTQNRNGITVTAAVLSPEESKQAFGVNLARKGIQPVWLKIENQTDGPINLLWVALDPEYFSAREAAYKSRLRFRGSQNKKMARYFAEHELHGFIPPGGFDSGFIFANLDMGAKYVNVLVYAFRGQESFTFYFEVPGLKVDFEHVDFDALYSDDEIVDYEDEVEFRAALEALPCCTTKRDGTGKGDPINFVLVGNRDDMFGAFIRRGWHVTERITKGTAWKTFRSGVFGGRYRYSPMSALYVYGRGQDLGLQKARDTIHERNHLRLWLAPMRFRGEEVFLGAISRDIGVYFTTRAWNLTTHAIDQDIDESRSYLLEDLVMSQSVKKIGYVRGVGAATEENPHRNLMKAPWWTDGTRAVFLFSHEPTGLTELELWPWAWGDEETTEAINEYLRRQSK
ncbi:MAG: LssY C-terminal domain-containing protein, partial [Candidatus Methylomirabilales bacterium]